MISLFFIRLLWFVMNKDDDGIHEILPQTKLHIAVLPNAEPLLGWT